MADPKDLSRLSQSAQRLIREVGAREARAARARDQKRTIWTSIAVLGTVGWSVTLPTLLGAAVGIWLDHNLPGRFSWTLTSLAAGLLAGCAIAWLRIKKEQR